MITCQFIDDQDQQVYVKSRLERAFSVKSMTLWLATFSSKNHDSKLIDWLSKALRPTKHITGHIGDGFLRVKW